MSASTIAIIITIAVVVMYALEIFPISITALISCLAMVVFGAAGYKTAFSGFANDVTFMVAGMMVVGDCLFETGAAGFLGKRLVAMFGRGEKSFITVTILLTALISAFLSNSATVAMMMPIMAAAVASSNGKLSKKRSYMPVGFAAVAGGGCTLIGSTPQLIAQGMIVDAGGAACTFFDYLWIGLPMVVLMLVYFLTFGYKLSQKVFDFEEPVDEIVADTDDSQARFTPKMLISVLILAGCVVGFITQLWSYGVVSMLGAVLCVVTRCMNVKVMYRKLDWSTIVVVGAGLSFAACLDESGAGVVIANSIVDFIGRDASPWLLLAAIGLLATVMGNIMSHSATTAILCPIAIFMAKDLGIDVRTMGMVVVMFCNITFSTPISTPPNTLTLQAGYRFSDYLKVGGVLNILAYLLRAVLLPVYFKL